MPRLEKVYIQCTKDANKSVEERFKALSTREIPVVLIEATDLFHIPQEF
jgi:hypothetical protein